MQKLLPWSHVIIFCNERTRSTPLDRNIMFIVFHSVLVPLGMFCYGSKLSAKRAELMQLMQKLVPRSRCVISRNDCTRSTPLFLNSCFWAFHSARVDLGMFRWGSKLGAKRAELVHLVQKFERRSRVGIFHNERTQTSPYDPKLIFWRVS